MSLYKKKKKKKKEKKRKEKKKKIDLFSLPTFSDLKIHQVTGILSETDKERCETL